MGMIFGSNEPCRSRGTCRRTSPTSVLTHRHTHALLQTLLVRERRSSGLRELAARCQVQR
jgi:hypothetical protein